MAWTYNITAVEFEAGVTRVNVDFTDGKRVYAKTFFPNSVDVLKRTIQSELTVATNNSAVADQVTVGTIDLTVPEVTPPEVVPPTADELAQRSYLAKRAALKQAKEDLELGLIDQAAFDAVQSDAVAARSGVKVVPVAITLDGI